ncbi:MAG TPA: zinc-ribbon domain-containing protein [Pyrinomonadaceae bacterium]|jgi:hypothetical protein
MQPEISRRCRECGAAIRVRASFCPQCGKPLGASASTDAAADGAEAAPPPSSPEVQPGAPVMAAVQAAHHPAQAVVQDNQDVPVSSAGEQLSPEGAPVEELEGDGARGRLHRARAAARDKVEEKIAPRVEKIRHASTAVLDEASDDPSLRFVLIAAALFIVALLLLLLSHVLG